MTSHSSKTDTKDTTISGINIPPVIFGTSGLGNLFVAPDYETKRNIVRECVHHTNGRGYS